MLSLLAMLAKINVVLEGEDEIHCPHDSCGQFTVISYCEESFKGSSQLDLQLGYSKVQSSPQSVLLCLDGN